jgi:hypothetical protein
MKCKNERRHNEFSRCNGRKNSFAALAAIGKLLWSVTRQGTLTCDLGDILASSVQHAVARLARVNAKYLASQTVAAADGKEGKALQARTQLFRGSSTSAHVVQNAQF